MKEQKITLVTGALLHDIGKVLFRCHEGGKTHSESGAEWLRSIGISDKMILDQVKYHHSHEIRNSGNDLSSDSMAYITYWADNVAAGADRRDNDQEQEGQLYVRRRFCKLSGRRKEDDLTGDIQPDSGQYQGFPKRYGIHGEEHKLASGNT